MRLVSFIFAFLLPFICFSQPRTVEMCDTLTGEKIQVEWVGDIADCCYEWIESDWTKRDNCDNVGPCKEVETTCYVGQSKYWMVDNPGTFYNENAIYEIKWDDGTVSYATQMPTGSWSLQIGQEWAENTFEDGQNYASGAEKCIETASCNVLPNGCGGLPPPNAEILNSGVDISSMKWRYLGVKCCYKERVPIEITIFDSDNPNRIGRKLPVVVFYGEQIQYSVCESCGEEPIYYYFGTTIEVPEIDIPICVEPCGFQFPAVVSPNCDFEYRPACDQNNLDGDGNAKSIEIQFVNCGDGWEIQGFYVFDNGNFIEYTPIEIDVELNLDDCNGGVVEPPIFEPEITYTESQFCYDSDGDGDFDLPGYYNQQTLQYYNQQYTLITETIGCCGCNYEVEETDPCAFIRCPEGTTATPNEEGGCDCIENQEINNYAVTFKTSGIQQIVSSCGTWNGNFDFTSPLGPPQSSDDNGSQMQQAKISIDAWLAANGGGTVRLEYVSQSVVTITVTGSPCIMQTANDNSNPGPHNFSQI